MKRKMSIILTLILILSTVLGVTVSAESYPSLSSSAYCEFTAAKNMNVYTDFNFSSRGTSSPYKKYSASVSKNDVCYIYKITSNYVQLSYPTSSGRRIGFVRTKDLLGSNTNPSSSFTAKEKVNTLKYKNGAVSGYYEYGDKVYNIPGTYYNTIYQARSGKRAYKLTYSAKVNSTSSSGVTTKFAWPVGGNGGYDNRNWPKYNTSNKYHSGTDISASKGTPVYAVYSGNVCTVKSLKDSYGKHVIIKCNVDGKTVYMYYAHLDSFNVNVGDVVKTGQQIGRVGSTGNSSGPHLHFEVRNSSKHYGNINNPTLNPYNYLPTR